MLRHKRLDVLTLCLARINRCATGTMQHRLEAHLLLDAQWANRDRLVFRRAWDHRVASKDNKKRTAIV